MPLTTSERFRRWRTNKCSGQLRTFIVASAFVVLAGCLYVITFYLNFRYKFILYILLIFMFITFCSCLQNIYTRLNKLLTKCFRKMNPRHDNNEVGDGSSTEGSNSRARNTPLAWSDGQDDNPSRQSGAYTFDHVYQLPSLGQMDDPPPRYDDVIASDPLPPSYEEATKT